MKRVLITGGAGFIGSNLTRLLIEARPWHVVVLDALTYAGNLTNLKEFENHERFDFVHADLRDRKAVDDVLKKIEPEVIFHLAAESHVDRSIDSPRPFVTSNVVGTFELLDSALAHISGWEEAQKSTFRFVHVSTDEVFGSLGPQGSFSEDSPFAPNSPYAATKAGADHLVRSYFQTFGLPTLTIHCCNNFGPHQFPEKLVPLMILNALEGKELPIYGDGKHVRDWLHVKDHCQALLLAAEKGRPGQSYCVGSGNQRSTIQVVETICSLLDEDFPPHAPHRQWIRFVKDRPGHDRRYALDTSKTRAELGWTPDISFEQGMRQTLHWYKTHRAWCKEIVEKGYDRNRLGLLENRP
jgi:dTDP-glucose 4,6-dehydratase